MDDAVLLIEIDNQFNGGDEDDLGFVTPRSNEEGSETESANPFVKLEFTSEGSEYEVCPDGRLPRRRGHRVRRTPTAPSR